MPSAGWTTARVRRWPRTIGRPSDRGTNIGNSGSSVAANSSDSAFPAMAATALASCSDTTSRGVAGVASMGRMKLTRQFPSMLGFALESAVPERGPAPAAPAKQAATASRLTAGVIFMAIPRCAPRPAMLATDGHGWQSSSEAPARGLYLPPLRGEVE